MDFNHLEISNEASVRLSLNDEEASFLSKHIRFDGLYDFERLTFCNGNAIQEIKYMAAHNETFNFSISHSSCDELYRHGEFLKFKEDIGKLKTLLNKYT